MCFMPVPNSGVIPNLTAGPLRACDVHVVAADWGRSLRELGRNRGLLSQFLDSKQLIVNADAEGESLAPVTVSDKLTDKANSVFNPVAASERKIEVTDIKIKKGK